MPTSNLCSELLKQYQCQTKSQQLNSAAAAAAAAANGAGSVVDQHADLDEEYLIAKKAASGQVYSLLDAHNARTLFPATTNPIILNGKSIS